MYDVLTRGDYKYLLRLSKLYILFKEKVYMMLNLNPVIDGKKLKFNKVIQSKDDYILSCSDSETVGVVKVENGRICYYVDLVSGYHKNIQYFCQSYINYSILRGFSSDYENYHPEWDKSFESVTTSIFPYEEEETNAVRTWHLAPQPRAFAIKLQGISDEEKAWFGISVPGKLPVGVTRFKQYSNPKAIKVEFEDYFADSCSGKLPSVYFFNSLADSYRVLEKHNEVSELCLTENRLEFCEWWANPIVCPASDLAQRYKVFEGNKCNYDIKYYEILDLIIFLEKKININHFTVILEAYWFNCSGDYMHANGFIFENNYNLRNFIDTLHGRGHKVVLWMSHFNMDYKELRELGLDNNMVFHNGNYNLLDYSFSSVRDYIQCCIKHMLGNDIGALDADGIKLDFGFLTPAIRNYAGRDGVWAIGDQLRAFVNELIYTTAHSVKKDALVSDTTTEPYVLSDMVRLNDNTDASIDVWLERAAKASFTKKIIDTDGYLMDSEKLKRYLMIAPAIGVPSIYSIKIFFNFDEMKEKDYRRLSATWNVYMHSPVNASMEVVVNKEESLYYRKYTNGDLVGFYSAKSFYGRCFAAYTSKKIMLCAVSDLWVEIEIPDGYEVDRAYKCTWNGRRIYLDLSKYILDNSVLVHCEDSGESEVKWIEILLKNI